MSFLPATQKISNDDEVIKKKKERNFDVRGENMTKEDYLAHHKKHLVRCVVVRKRVVKILQTDDKEIGRVEFVIFLNRYYDVDVEYFPQTMCTVDAISGFARKACQPSPRWSIDRSP